MPTLRLGWHFDFHSHPVVRIGDKPDAEGVGEACARAGMEIANTFAKCHSGFSYYPTDVGNRHPRLVGDPFGDVLNACQKRGVKVAAYVSFGIDGVAVTQNPSWEHVPIPGHTSIGKDIFISVCPFTPYMDDLMLPQIDEIIERYHPDGIWFDTMSALRTCYCDACRKAYQDASGNEIPVEPDDPEWGPYGVFRHQRAYDLLAMVGRHITAQDPDNIVAFNQVGSLGYAEPLPEGIERVSLDFATYAHQSRNAALHASYGLSLPCKADVMPTRFNQGWGDWSPSSAAMLEQVSAATWAHRGGLYMGGRLHPQNRMSPGAAEALDTIAATRDAMLEEMPPDEASRTPDVVILHGPGMVYGHDMRNFARDARINLHPLDGIHHVLLDAGCNTIVAAEYTLETWLRPDRLLVIAHTESITEESDALIRDFLAQGGRVLVIGKPPVVKTDPMAQGAPIDWIGATLEDEPWLDHVYLPPMGDEDAALVRGDYYRVKLDGAEAEMFAIPPYDVRHGQRMGWAIAPPEDEPSDSPILTRNSVGTGKVWLLACDLGPCYAANGNFTQAQWMTRLITRLQPDAAARLQAPSGSVDLVTYADDATTWCVLVNHGGEQLISAAGKPWARQLGPLPPYDVTLQLRAPEGRKAKSISCAGNSCAASHEGDLLSLPVCMNVAWRVVRVDWE